MFFEGLPCGHLLEATAKERQHDLLKGLSKAGKTEACRHRLSGRGAHLTVCSTVVILITRIMRGLIPLLLVCTPLIIIVILGFSSSSFKFVLSLFVF